MIQLYALGLDHTEAADYLGRTNNSVRARNARVRAMTGSPDTPSLVHWALVNHVIKPIPLWRPLRLLQHEVEMVELLSVGYTRGQAARRLAVTPKAIDSRLFRAMRKTRAYSRAHLVAMYYSESCYLYNDLLALEIRGSVWEEWYGNRM